MRLFKRCLFGHKWVRVYFRDTDAYGIPYGYKVYKCSRCGATEKRFWYS